MTVRRTQEEPEAPKEQSDRVYDGPLSDGFGDLQRRVVACQACPRLVEYRKRVAREKRPRYADWDYWGAPVPSHGDPAARLLLVGLAPAAHGANRTGRMFTGDASADFLMAALYRAGFSSQPSSQHRGDNLKMLDAYETAVVRCVPPQDRPTSEEQRLCRRFLVEEIGLLSNLRAVLAFGHIAFDNYLRALSDRLGEPIRRTFRHGTRYDLGFDLPALFASYHPSPRNTNTGRLSQEGLATVLNEVQRWLNGQG